MELRIREQRELGQDRGRGNLVGIQAWMETADYRDQASFHAKMQGYMEAARSAGWLADNSVVVFPEYIGTWLVAVDERPALTAADKIDQAMKILVKAHPLAFARSFVSAKGSDRVKDALFRMKSARIAQIYHETFSLLARQYRVTLVAGSVVLPAPTVSGGRLRVGTGPLQNITAVYRPDGTPYEQLTVKIYPITDELPFTSCGAVSALPTYQTPAGKMAVLICADSWYPAPYDWLRDQAPDFVVVPNNLTPGDAWRKPWQGYLPGPAPQDVEAADVGRLTEGEAWKKYALGGRLAPANVPLGLHVFFQGSVWDLSSGGPFILVRDGHLIEGDVVDDATLVCCWH